jgi:hypothetical protein
MKRSAPATAVLSDTCALPGPAPRPIVNIDIMAHLAFMTLSFDPWSDDRHI